MKTCENCGKEHDGSYGSGRFCSHSCQASFTNKNRGKRNQETIEKIRKTLKEKHPRKLFTCLKCGKQFERYNGYKSSRRYCSLKCKSESTPIKNWEDINKKINETKRKNHTFKSSKKELEVFNQLKEKFPDIIYQYYSSEYPFNCDFYVPSLKLYIEYNGTWTHGGHIFNEYDKNDIQKLNNWKSKNTKYYNNAIYTWTDLDIRKQKYVKQNNLNYFIIWNENDLNKLLEK